MMVMLELQFQKYLGGATGAIQRVCNQLPRAIDLKRKGDHKGDFDVLMISRRYGFITAEVKSVGPFPDDSEEMTIPVVKKVMEAVDQLDKSQRVLNHLLSDLAPVRVTKTLMLPNITSHQLHLALSSDTKAAEVSAAIAPT